MFVLSIYRPLIRGLILPCRFTVLKCKVCKCTKIAGEMNAKNDRGVNYGGNIFSEGIGKGISQ